MKPNSLTKAENINQAEAFSRLSGDTIENIWKYGADFRAIIEDFEANFGRVPTADDLLWIESEKLGHDITTEK